MNSGTELYLTGLSTFLMPTLTGQITFTGTILHARLARTHTNRIKPTSAKSLTFSFMPRYNLTNFQSGFGDFLTDKFCSGGGRSEETRRSDDPN